MIDDTSNDNLCTGGDLKTDRYNKYGSIHERQKIIIKSRYYVRVLIK